MVTISLCLIAKDEEEVIKRCIDSVKDAMDEIIVVDTGSNDKTKEIATNCGAKVYDFEWVDDFAKARNFAFSKATKEYIFWLDCDDVLFKEDCEELIKLKSTLNRNVDALSMAYALTTDEDGNVTYSIRRFRLLKRAKNFKWIGRIHEMVPVSGNISHCNTVVIHHSKNKPYTDRNLKIFKNMIKDKVNFTTREIFYYANELYDNQFYYEAIKNYEDFLSHEDAFVEDAKLACIKMANCAFFSGDTKNELAYLLKSLEFDIPSSEVCCRLGAKFFEASKIMPAIYWYEMAIKNKPDENNVALVNRSMYTWIPYMQLCVCYYCLKDFEKAEYYNEKAAEYVPNNPGIENNRKCIRKFINKESQ